MDPFTLALATFGVQKLRGKSTRTALQSAALVGGASYGLGALGSAGKLGSFSQSATSMFSKPAFSSLGFGATQTVQLLHLLQKNKIYFEAYLVKKH
jgi:hypothetical protein